MGPHITDVPDMSMRTKSPRWPERSRPPDSPADIDVDDRLAPLTGALHQFTLERLELLGYLTLVRNVFLAQANAAKYHQAEFVRA